MSPVRPDPMIDLSRIGAALRAKREQSGLTIYEVGERAGVTGAYVSALERGNGNPTISVLQKIATAVGADIDMSILLPEGDPLALALAGLNQDELNWIRELAALAHATPDDTRRATLTMLRHSARVVGGESLAV